MVLAERRRTWLRLAFFTAGLLVAFAGLGVLLDGAGWWFSTALVVVLPMLAIGLAARFGRRGWQPPVAGFVVAIATLTMGFAGDRALLGVIPTLDTLGRWGELAGEGFASIAGQRIPAEADDGILFLLAILAVVCVAFIAPALDVVPAVAALPLLVVLDIPVAVRADIADPGWFVLAAIAYLALLRVGRRSMPLRAVVVTGAVVIVGALIVPAVLPPVRDQGGPSGSGFGTGLNPLIDLGDDLRRDEALTAVTYTTNAPGGLYLRLATLSEFNGLSWEPEIATDPENDIARFPAPPGLADAVPRAPYSASITVGDVSGRWLPVPYPAVAVTGVDGQWYWEADGLAVRASGGADARGQQFDVDFLSIVPDLAQLSATEPPRVSERYRALPEDLPEAIRATAEQVAGAGTTYERALALQDYFAGPASEFLYSLDAPVEEGYDGTGVGVVERFLEEKSGYCVHYASAMAIMARVVGIPSRIVVGFQPGHREIVDGRPVTVATTSDLHSWPEVYIEGVGWLRFEPTPGRGALPDYSDIAAVDDPSTPEIEGPATPATAAPVDPTTAPEDVVDDPAVDGPVEATTQTPAVLVAAIAAGVLALLLVPAGLRVVVRLRRMRLVRAGDAAAAWEEIRDTAHDHDWSAPDSETPRQLGARLAVVVGAEPVARLQDGVESAAYDRPGSPVMTVEEVAALRHAIADAAPLALRVRAVLLPPSLLARAGIGRPRDPLG